MDFVLFWSGTIDHRYELMNTLIFKYFGLTIRKVLGLLFNFGGSRYVHFVQKLLV